MEFPPDPRSCHRAQRGGVNGWQSVEETPLFSVRSVPRAPQAPFLKNSSSARRSGNVASASGSAPTPNRLVVPRRQRMADARLHEARGLDQGGEVDAGLDSQTVEHVDEILGREIGRAHV